MVQSSPLSCGRALFSWRLLSTQRVLFAVLSRGRHIPSPPRMAVRYAFPLGRFILLTPCPHPPRLIDLSCESPIVQSTPNRGKGCELFIISKSRQPLGAVVHRLMTIVIHHPTNRSEQPGHLARPLSRLPFRGRWLGFALSRRETDGTRRPHSRQSPR